MSKMPWCRENWITHENNKHKSATCTYSKSQSIDIHEIKIQVTRNVQRVVSISNRVQHEIQTNKIPRWPPVVKRGSSCTSILTYFSPFDCRISLLTLLITFSMNLGVLCTEHVAVLLPQTESRQVCSYHLRAGHAIKPTSQSRQVCH